MIVLSSTSDFLGKVGFNLTLCLVTSSYRQKPATCWRSAAVAGSGDGGDHGLRVPQRGRQHLHGAGPDTLPHQALPLQAHALRDPRRHDRRVCHHCRHRPGRLHHLWGVRGPPRHEQDVC